MANTIVEIVAFPGATTVTLASRGGTGTPANSYVPTLVLGSLHTITIPENLVGRFAIVDNRGATNVVTLEDIDGTIEIDGKIDSVKAITDQMRFTNPNRIDATSSATGTVEEFRAV